MSKNCIRAIEMTSLDTAGLAGDFAAINPDGLTESLVFMRITNDSDTDLVVSYDGATDNDYVRAGSTIDLNVQTNSLPNGKVAQFSKGTVIYVRSAAGIGLVYLAGYYQPVR